MQFNSLQKYRNSLVVYFLVNGLIASLVLYGVIVVPESGIYDSTPLIPFKNQFYEIFFVFLIIPLSSTLGALFGGYVLAPLYLLAHKTFYRKMIYGIQEIAPADGFKRAFRGYYPSRSIDLRAVSGSGLDLPHSHTPIDRSIRLLCHPANDVPDGYIDRSYVHH